MICSRETQKQTQFIHGDRSHTGDYSLQLSVAERGLERSFCSAGFYTLCWMCSLYKDLSSCTLKIREFTISKLHTTPQ